MSKPFPARTLAEVALQATLEPLPLGDPRYVDLSRDKAAASSDSSGNTWKIMPF